MLKFTFRKLIRDLILEKHLASGHDIESRILTGIKKKQALRDKLHEEADEIPIQDVVDDAVIEELADVQEVLDSLRDEYGITAGQLQKIQLEKRQAKGGFKKGVYVDSVSLSETDEWVGYYRKSPLKYHEVLQANETFDVPTLEPGVYRHYKGNMYNVLAVGCHTETHEYFVVYEALYEKENVPSVWIRPYEIFISTVEIDGKAVPRFERTD